MLKQRQYYGVVKILLDAAGRWTTQELPISIFSYVAARLDAECRTFS
jgi:hypothetical protein